MKQFIIPERNGLQLFDLTVCKYIHPPVAGSTVFSGRGVYPSGCIDTGFMAVKSEPEKIHYEVDPIRLYSYIMFSDMKWFSVKVKGNR